MVMETVTEDGLRSIAETLGAQPGVLRVILFGSRARGTASEHSDVDLLVICEGHPDKAETTQRLRELLPRRRFGIDLLVIGEQQFREEKDIIGTIAFPANKYGRVLHERSPAR